MKRIYVLLGFVLASLPGMSAAATLLSIDLSIANQITINAEPGLSPVTATGTDFTGFYLENFYGGPGVFPTATLVSGNLTTANETSDGSPQLWRGGGGTDLGLNVWSFAQGANTSVTAGQQAFSGSATWAVSSAVYADLLSGGGTFGNVYLNADTADDIPSATLIGEFAVAPVPLPAPVFLLGSAILGLGLYGRRRANTPERGRVGQSA